MVEALKNSVKSAIGQGVFLALSLMTVGRVDAEQLLDPTRPPDLVGSVQSSGVVPTVGPALQSVLISPQRRIAIISGKAVRMGEKFGDSRVESITETEVVLRNGKNLKTLKLFPDVQKRLTSNGTGAKTDHRR